MIFFFNDTATTEIYTLSLHDALPIWTDIGALLATDGEDGGGASPRPAGRGPVVARSAGPPGPGTGRGGSEEHTSELQSRQYLVCRLLLEKKKNTHYRIFTRLLSLHAL